MNDYALGRVDSHVQKKDDELKTYWSPSGPMNLIVDGSHEEGMGFPFIPPMKRVASLKVIG